jgi:hypothetical protein
MQIKLSNLTDSRCSHSLCTMLFIWTLCYLICLSLYDDVIHHSIHFLSSITCSMVHSFLKLNRCYISIPTIFSGVQRRALYTSIIECVISIGDVWRLIIWLQQQCVIITLCNIVCICMLFMQIQCGCQILTISRMQPATRMPIWGHQIGDARLTWCVSY